MNWIEGKICLYYNKNEKYSSKDWKSVNMMNFFKIADNWKHSKIKKTSNNSCIEVPFKLTSTSCAAKSTHKHITARVEIHEHDYAPYNDRTALTSHPTVFNMPSAFGKAYALSLLLS